MTFYISGADLRPIYIILQEALLMEPRNTNNDILENRNGESCLKGSQPFKKHIATVLVQLKEASG